MNTSPPIMPVRRLHNYAYCKRLFYLQWVEDLWVEDEHTAKGSHLHKNTDNPSHWKEEIELADRTKWRSIALESSTLGLRGVIDLIEDTGNGFELIDYKKGSSAKDSNGDRMVKENDALQLAAYALMLREQNTNVNSASIYYAAEKRRVSLTLDQALFDKCLKTIEEAKLTAESNICPPPLVGDNRCLHCSAYSICLPNESNYWAGKSDSVAKDKIPPRPPSDEGEIIVLQNPRAYVGIRAGELIVKIDKQIVSKHPLAQIQSIYLYGAVQVTTQATHALLHRSIPIGYFSPAGRFLGLTNGLPTSGIDSRLGQARIYNNEDLRLQVAKQTTRSKIHNQRVLLMRNGKPPKSSLSQLAELRNQCSTAKNLDSLRGVEGAAAHLYFESFGTMLKGTAFEKFDFNGRNRRPPKDPVNALLSMGYSILAKEITGICHAIGLDPFIGFFHQPRYGRPALALDLMEEFRPLIADSVAISLLNRGELDESDFIYTSKGVFLNDSGRRQYWATWFRRLDTEVKHPEFGYRMSYRRMLDVQARQYWRYCRGEAHSYHGFTTR